MTYEANEVLICLLDESDCEEHGQYIMGLEKVGHEPYNALVTGKEKVVKRPTLAIKKLELPYLLFFIFFSESVRLFLTFKKDFEKLVLMQQRKDPYVLGCLEGEPRKLVEDLDDYERVWSRLKETYGNPTKMIDYSN